MYTETTTVINQYGLHARPASVLVLAAKEFISEITIKNLSKPDVSPINAKMLMRILAADLRAENKVEITADGPDEQQAVKKLIELFEQNFSEKQ